MNSLTVRSKRIRGADAVDGGEAQAGGRERRRRRRASSALLDADLLLGVERDRARARRPRRSARSGRPCGRSSSTSRRTRSARTPALAASRDERARALDVDLAATAPGRARRRGRRRSRRGARPRRRPSSAAARASASRTSPRTSSTPGASQLGGDVLLAVQQRVEHAHRRARRSSSSSDEQRADVAGAAGDRYVHGRHGSGAPGRGGDRSSRLGALCPARPHSSPSRTSASSSARRCS